MKRFKEYDNQSFGRYELQGLIAKGGMGEIYLAHSIGVAGFEKLCVIKKILPHLAEDPEFIEKFIAEGKTLVELHHSNIVQVFDLGEFNGRYYMAMEYIPGKDLRAIIQHFREKREAMPLNLCACIVSEICKGLSYAHRRKDARGNLLGIVHRDISPSNILISREGEVKIIDFGIAKVNAKKTVTGQIQGKFGYMSPEQARGDKLDARSDIFSTGIVLYEMVTGVKAFPGDSDLQCLEKVKRADFSNPFLHRPDIDEKLHAILLKALSVAPEDRFQSADDFLVALTEYLSESKGIMTPQAVVESIGSDFLSTSSDAFLRGEDFLEHAMDFLLLQEKEERATQSVVVHDKIKSDENAPQTLSRKPISRPLSLPPSQRLRPANTAPVMLVVLLVMVPTMALVFFLFSMSSDDVTTEAPMGLQQYDTEFRGKTEENVSETKISTPVVRENKKEKKADAPPVDNFKAFSIDVDPPRAQKTLIRGIVNMREDGRGFFDTGNTPSWFISLKGYENCTLSMSANGDKFYPKYDGCESVSLEILNDDGNELYNFRVRLVPVLPQIQAKDKNKNKNNGREDYKTFFIQSDRAAIFQYRDQKGKLPSNVRVNERDFPAKITISPDTDKAFLPYLLTVNKDSASSLNVNFCELNITLVQSFVPFDPAPYQLADIGVDGRVMAKSADRLRLVVACGKHNVSVEHRVSGGMLKAAKSVSLIAGESKTLKIAMQYVADN